MTLFFFYRNLSLSLRKTFWANNINNNNNIDCAYLESDYLHTKNWAVKIDGIWDTFHCEHQMIQMAHFNGTASFVSDSSQCLNAGNLQEMRASYDLKIYIYIFGLILTLWTEISGVELSANSDA